MKRRLRNRVHRVLKSTRTVKRDLAWPGQSPWPLYGKSDPGRPVGLSTQQGTSELVWANRLSLGVGLCGVAVLPLGSQVLPQSQPSAKGFRASGRQALQGPH